MKYIRLFHDECGEAMTDVGNTYSDKIREALHPIITEALTEGISFRDLRTLISEEAMLVTAEKMLRRGIAEHKANREAWAAQAARGERGFTPSDYNIVRG